MLEKIIKTFGTILSCVCIFFLLGLFVSVLVGVATRYFLSNPSSWTEEVARYFQVWLTFIGAPLGFITLSHIGIRYLPEALNPIYKFVLDLFINCIVIFVCFFMFFDGIKFTRFTWSDTLQSLDVSMGMMSYLVVPISAVLITIAIILNVIRSTKELRSRKGED